MAIDKHVDVIIATQKKIEDLGVELEVMSTVLTAMLMNSAERLSSDLGEALKILAKEAGSEVKAKKTLGLNSLTPGLN